MCAVLALHTESVEATIQSSKLLRLLCKLGPHCSAETPVPAMFEGLLAALDVHMREGTLQVDGICVLSWLSQFLPMAEPLTSFGVNRTWRRLQPDATPPGACVAEAVLDLLLVAIAEHAELAFVRAEACAALAHFSQQDATFCALAICNGGIASAVDCLRAKPTVTECEQSSLRALDVLTSAATAQALLEAGGVEETLQAIERNQSSMVNAGVVTLGCSVLAKAAQNIEVAVSLRDSGACGTVLKAMRLMVQSADVQASGIFFLASLAAHGEHFVREVVRCSAISAVLAAMRRYAHDSAVQSHACHVLSSLCSTHRSTAVGDVSPLQAVSDGAALVPIVKAIELNPLVCEVLEHGCSAVEHLVRNSTDNVSVLGECGGFSILVRTVSENRSFPSASLYALRALCHCVSLVRSTVLDVVAARAIPAVVGFVQAAASLSSVGGQASKFLAILAGTNASVAKQILLADGVNAIAAAMEASLASAHSEANPSTSNLPECKVLHKNGCSLVVAMCKHMDDQLVMLTIDQGGVGGVMQTLNAFPFDIDLLAKAVNALLLLSGYKFMGDRLLAAGAFGAVITLMLREMDASHPDYAETLLHCCQFLMNVTEHKEDFATKVCELNGVKAIVLATSKCGPRADITQTAYSALGHISRHSLDLAQKVAHEGGMHSIVGAMGASVHSLTTQLNSCMALAMFTEKSYYLTDKVVSAGGIGALINAMNAHKDHPGVQLYGALALGNLATQRPPIDEVEPRTIRALESAPSKGQTRGTRRTTSFAADDKSAEGLLRFRKLSNMRQMNEIVTGNMQSIRGNGSSLPRFPFLQAVTRETVRSHVGHLDAADVVTAALRYHTAEQKVQRHAISALGSFALISKKVAKKIVQLDGLDLAISAMEVHMKDEDFIQAGCSAIEAIVGNGTTHIPAESANRALPPCRRPAQLLLQRMSSQRLFS